MLRTVPSQVNAVLGGTTLGLVRTLRMKTVRLVLSVLLGLGTCTLIGHFARQPSAAGGRWEYLLLPGATFAMLVSPGGVHGPRPQFWVLAILVGNVLFYSALWLIVLTLVARRLETPKPKAANP